MKDTIELQKQQKIATTGIDPESQIPLISPKKSTYLGRFWKNCTGGAPAIHIALMGTGTICIGANEFVNFMCNPETQTCNDRNLTWVGLGMVGAGVLLTTKIAIYQLSCCLQNSN